MIQYRKKFERKNCETSQTNAKTIQMGSIVNTTTLYSAPNGPKIPKMIQLRNPPRTLVCKRIRNRSYNIFLAFANIQNRGVH
jgi:hypothetical protein